MRNFRGTSACAPIVSGALALAFSANPNLTASEARECLIRSAAKTDETCPFGETDDEGHSPCFGYGRLDAERLVVLAASGDCGGSCRTQEDCLEGTYCNVDEGLCRFGETFSKVDAGVDAGGEDESDAGEFKNLSGTVTGCSCSTIG